jgi:hypothetical protein
MEGGHGQILSSMIGHGGLPERKGGEESRWGGAGGVALGRRKGGREGRHGVAAGGGSIPYCY